MNEVLTLCLMRTQAGSGLGGILLGLLNIVVTDLNILLGVDCNPLSGVGIGGNTCDAHPVCCENNAVVSYQHLSAPITTN